MLLTSPSSRPPASRPSFHVLAEDGSEERTEETSELSQPNWWVSHHRPSPPPAISPAVELMLLLLHRRCHSDGLGSEKAM